jgi:hypothetical protein
MAAAAGALQADLSAVRAESNLEKRSDKALQHAAKVIDSLRETYRTGEWKAVEAALDEIRAAVELSSESLHSTGKKARRSPKHFKRAELRTRELARRLDSFAQEVSVDERPAVEKVRAFVVKIHDDFLNDIMGQKH